MNSLWTFLGIYWEYAFDRPLNETDLPKSSRAAQLGSSNRTYNRCLPNSRLENKQGLRITSVFNARCTLTVADVLHLSSRLFRSRLLVHDVIEHLQFPLQIGCFRVFRIWKAFDSLFIPYELSKRFSLFTPLTNKLHEPSLIDRFDYSIGTFSQPVLSYIYTSFPGKYFN